MLIKYNIFIACTFLWSFNLFSMENDSKEPSSDCHNATTDQPFALPPSVMSLSHSSPTRYSGPSSALPPLVRRGSESGSDNDPLNESPKLNPIYPTSHSRTGSRSPSPAHDVTGVGQFGEAAGFLAAREIKKTFLGGIGSTGHIEPGVMDQFAEIAENGTQVTHRLDAQSIQEIRQLSQQGVPVHHKINLDAGTAVRIAGVVGLASSLHAVATNGPTPSNIAVAATSCGLICNDQTKSYVQANAPPILQHTKNFMAAHWRKPIDGGIWLAKQPVRPFAACLNMCRTSKCHKKTE